VANVAAYEPGQFYKRELPCLLAVLKRLRRTPDILVIDGFVWLDGNAKQGLGAHLHTAYEQRPVVGIAKTRFASIAGTMMVEEVRRGASSNPLYVTAVGVELTAAADYVRRMHGEHRIPELVRLTDRLARTAELDLGSSVSALR
jgi:deoxyribonuclease V